MAKRVFIDLSGEPAFYAFEKRAGSIELRDKKPIRLTGDYDISLPDTAGGADEYFLSLPVSALNFRLLELPFSDKEKILGVLPFELEGKTLRGAGEIVIDGIVLGTDNGNSRVLAVYAEKSFLNKIITKLQALGIDPKIITSLELRHMLKDFDPGKLFEPVGMKPEERADAAGEEIKGSCINLRRGDLAYTKDTEKIKKSLKLTASLSAAVFILLILTIALKVFSIKKETAFIEGEINRVYSGIFPGEKTMPGIYQFKSKLKELKGREESLIGVSPLGLLSVLSGIERGSSAFNEIAMDRGRVTLRGDSATFSDLQKIKEELGKVLDDVNIADSKTSAQGRVIFTVTARERKI